eukprot:scaffold30780_cov122-Amphora_coffeaeformis.AAC.2
MGLAGLREGGRGRWARGWAGARVAMGGTGAAAMTAISTTISTTAISTTAVSAVAAGEAIEVPEKWVAAALKGRTNVANRGKSSGRGGKGRGGRWAWGKRLGRVSTASTTLSADRKGSSTGVGWVGAMGRG